MPKLNKTVGFFIIAAAVVGVTTLAVLQKHAPVVPIDVSTWKTYTDQMTGFTIKYPPQYEATGGFNNTPEWGSSDFVTISDPADTSTYEFHVVTMHSVLQKQPFTATGEIYHTIAEYQKSSAAANMVQGTPDPDGELVDINGEQALKYYFPGGDASDAASYAYFFIKNDLMYQLFFNADNSYREAMVQSITFGKPNPVPLDTSAYVGVITDNADGSRTYISTRYGLSLTFPKAWYVGDNHLGYGTFQLSNYDPADPNLPAKDSMPPGFAKIEMATIDASSSEPSSDYPEQIRSSQRVTVAGQSALATEVTYTGGNKTVSYIIALPTEPKYLLIAAHAGSDQTSQESAFSTLDKIVKSLSWDR